MLFGPKVQCTPLVKLNAFRFVNDDYVVAIVTALSYCMARAACRSQLLKLEGGRRMWLRHKIIWTSQGEWERNNGTIVKRTAGMQTEVSEHLQTGIIARTLVYKRSGPWFLKLWVCDRLLKDYSKCSWIHAQFWHVSKLVRFQTGALGQCTCSCRNVYRNIL
jgi:hypothetical protein